MTGKVHLVVPVALLMVALPIAGCLGSVPANNTSALPSGDDGGGNETRNASRFMDPNATGPEPPSDEDYTGIQPQEIIWGGSIRHPDTQVLLIPPAHGDLGNPTNMSRSGLAYLEATLTGIFAWEPAIERFIETYPQYRHLDNITIDVELFDGDNEIPGTAGYDIVAGYAETSGPRFRGVAFDPTASGDISIQQTLDDLGVGDQVHYGNRYILLSLFASAPRSDEQRDLGMDYPETHEIRGVMMHEFAHTWGLGHSTTWTRQYGPDLMNSPYPFVYGDGDPVGDGGERTEPLCITSLNLVGLAKVYSWIPDNRWQPTNEDATLPQDVLYGEYCDVFDEARERAQAWLADRGITSYQDYRELVAAVHGVPPAPLPSAG